MKYFSSNHMCDGSVPGEGDGSMLDNGVVGVLFPICTQENQPYVKTEMSKEYFFLYKNIIANALKISHLVQNM
jgi:hypothetical protein